MAWFLMVDNEESYLDEWIKIVADNCESPTPIGHIMKLNDGTMGI